MLWYISVKRTKFVLFPHLSDSKSGNRRTVSEENWKAGEKDTIEPQFCPEGPGLTWDVRHIRCDIRLLDGWDTFGTSGSRDIAIKCERMILYSPWKRSGTQTSQSNSLAKRSAMSFGLTIPRPNISVRRIIAFPPFLPSPSLPGAAAKYAPLVEIFPVGSPGRMLPRVQFSQGRDILS